MFHKLEQIRYLLLHILAHLPLFLPPPSCFEGEEPGNKTTQDLLSMLTNAIQQVAIQGEPGVTPALKRSRCIVANVLAATIVGFTLVIIWRITHIHTNLDCDVVKTTVRYDIIIT